MEEIKRQAIGYTFLFGGVAVGGYLVVTHLDDITSWIRKEILSTASKAAGEAANAVEKFVEHPPWEWKDDWVYDGSIMAVVPHEGDGFLTESQLSKWSNRYWGTYDAWQSANVATQSAWLTATPEQKKKTEQEWYAKHPKADFTKDIHSQTGYTGATAEHATKDLVLFGYWKGGETYDEWVKLQGANAIDRWMRSTPQDQQAAEEAYYRDVVGIQNWKNDIHSKVGYYTPGVTPDGTFKDALRDAVVHSYFGIGKPQTVPDKYWEKGDYLNQLTTFEFNKKLV